MRLMNPLNAEKTALERAFEIVRAGRWRRTDDIRRQLQQEGFHYRQVKGPLLARKLADAARLARLERPQPVISTSR